MSEQIVKIDAEEMILAYKSGEARGAAMKKGSHFIGVSEEFSNSGFPDVDVLKSLFTRGFREALHLNYPQGVSFDAEHIITD